MVIHDHATGRWLQIEGPGLDVTIENVTWAGNTIVFDKVDVGFSEPRPKEMTRIHVEINLDEPTIERIVPIGPYTSNPH